MLPTRAFGGHHLAKAWPPPDHLIITFAFMLRNPPPCLPTGKQLISLDCVSYTTTLYDKGGVQCRATRMCDKGSKDGGNSPPCVICTSTWQPCVFEYVVVCTCQYVAMCMSQYVAVCMRQYVAECMSLYVARTFNYPPPPPSSVCVSIDFPRACYNPIYQYFLNWPNWVPSISIRYPFNKETWSNQIGYIFRDSLKEFNETGAKI